MPEKYPNAVLAISIHPTLKHERCRGLITRNRWQNISTILEIHTKRHIMVKYNIIMSNKIKCSHILVAKHQDAVKILERINDGDKFGMLAKKLSLDSGSAKKDGNLGYFTRGKMVKQFEEAAFGLQIGQVAGPIKTEFGYHIIKRLG